MKNQKQREPDIPWWLALCVVVVLYKGVVFFLGAIFPKESTEWGSLISGVPIMIFSLLAVITCTGGTKGKPFVFFGETAFTIEKKEGMGIYG